MDFVKMIDGRPSRLVECKLSDTKPAQALAYLKRKFPSVEAVQVVAKAGVDRVAEPGIRVRSADAFLRSLVI